MSEKDAASVLATASLATEHCPGASTDAAKAAALSNVMSGDTRELAGKIDAAKATLALEWLGTPMPDICRSIREISRGDTPLAGPLRMR